MIEVGMDQHKHFSAAAALNPATGEVLERRLEHEDVESIRTFVESFEGEVRVTLETTGNWYWLADLVEEAGATVQLCHAAEAKRLRRGKAKNDRLDALALARLSAEDRVPLVYVPRREDRDRRERHRFRIRLVRLQTALKNLVHSILSKVNIQVPFEDAFGKGGRAFLNELSLREPYDSHLRSALRILDVLGEEISREHGAIREELQSNELAPILMTAPGIGELTAFLMLYEIGPITRFATEKAFASYCCVAPRTAQSAEWHGHPGVGRAGNLYLKEAFSNAALAAIRKDPTLRVFYNRQLRRHGGKIAKIAAAHKLAVAVYHMLRRRHPYRPAPILKKTSGKPVLPLGRP